MVDLNTYSPTNPNALGLVDLTVQLWPPLYPVNARLGVLINGGLWAEPQNALNDRWSEWKLM